MTRQAHSPQPKVNHRAGISIASVGVIALSFDAVFIRLANVSPQEATFARGCFIFIALAGYLVVDGRRDQFVKLIKYRWVALFVCCIYGFNSAVFVFAVSYTTVANTVIILCCTPFFAAIFSWFLIHEKIDRMTWLTIGVAVAGVVIVFVGTEGPSSLLGNSLALVLALATGFLLSFLRRYPHLPRVPAIALGASLSSIILLPNVVPFGLTVTSLTWLAVTGLVLKPLASVCMLVATRYIPSPEVSIFLLLETLLAPIWAWLLLDESVSAMTLVGGTTVLAMVTIHCGWQINKER